MPTIAVWLAVLLAPGGATAVATWPANAPADQVTGYRLLYGTVSGQYTVTVPVGNVLTATVTGLTPGTTYYFTLEAVNAIGVSPPAPEVVLVVPAVVVPPACLAPLGAQAIAIFPTALQHTGSGGGGSKARLDFQLASQSPITHVAVRANSVDLAAMDGTNLTAIAGLWLTVPPTGTYPLSIRAVNSFGCTQDQTTFTVAVP